MDASQGLPVYLNSATPLTSLSGTLEVDAQLLLNADWVAGADLPDDWTLTVTPAATAGHYQFEASGTTALSGTDLEVLRLLAEITADAAPTASGELYGSTTLIQATAQSDSLTGINFALDPGLIALAYSGDATGNGNLSALDASYLARVVVDLESGFDRYDQLNPGLIADTTGNGTLSALDASMILRQVVGLSVDSFPTIPELIA